MNAVLFAPHNDDETLFAFHTMRANDAHVAVVLRSFKEALNGGPGFERRERETDCAMGVAGVTWEQWSHSDLEPDWPLIARQIVLRLSGGYAVVIAPAVEKGGHEHHNALGLIVERLVPADRLIRYTTYVRGQGRSEHGAEVKPTASQGRLKRLALACYASQAKYPPTAPWFGRDQREFVL